MHKQKRKKLFNKNWRLLALAVLAIVFFIATSSFNYYSQAGEFNKWLSPDETANYTFAKYYGQERSLRIFEKNNLLVKDIIHPRSVKSVNGELKPVSFLGIILIYGKFVGLFGYKALPYLTPFFASLGLIFFYLLIKKLFGKRNAFISAFLLASFPPYIYYSARSMFHNVLFIVLLIIGFYFIVLSTKDKRKEAGFRNLSLPDWRGWLYAGLAGFFISLSIAVRTSEMLWILPLLIILWLFNFKRVGIYKFLIFIIFLYSAMLPVFYWNQILYGFPYFGGYPEMNSSLAGITSTSAEILRTTAIGDVSAHKDLFNRLKDFIFFFGFKPKQSLGMLYAYFVRMFPWLFASAIIGGSLFFVRVKRLKKKYIVYLLGYLVISIILIFYYGSWKFHDNPDPGSFTIGNSYTRYWLPIYIGALPFASYFIMLITRSLFPRQYFKDKKKLRNVLIKGLRVLIVASLAATSVYFVLFGSEEGLAASAERLRKSRYELERVLELTEYNSTIITQYHDKLFFPERKVIYGLFNDDKMLGEYKILTGLLPVYYYNFTLPMSDIEYLNTRRLAESELGIEPVAEVTGDFSLYRLVLNNDDSIRVESESDDSEL